MSPRRNATTARVARFLWIQYSKTGKNKPNYHQYIPNLDINQHIPLQGPPKWTQIEIFGLTIYHLATLPPSKENPD
jgi:hypothetical protein